jgi:DNA invertase Pin-like site-specific DNA recombinase
MRSMKLIAYLRVSTMTQAEEGLGLDVQRAAIRAWAREHDHRVLTWTSDEGVSGSNGLEAREGLAEALSALRTRAADALVVYRLDRLARDLVLQEQLLREVWRLGSRVWSTSPSEDAYLDPDAAGDDPSRTLIRQVLGAVAQYERSMIRLRLRSGKARKRAVGGYVGGQVALGWRTEGGVLVEDEDEQATLGRIIELRERGRSLRAICEQLAVEGRSPKRGDRWYPYTISQVLARATAQNS